MSDSELPDAPDLGAAGYPLSDLAGLAEGAMTPAVYEESRIALLKHDGKVLAFEGACTHYGAPLDEGVFDGTCIRCPWHHARFDIQNGSHIAPAYKPLKRYATEERDGRLFITGEAADAHEPRPIEAAPESVVIAGGGAAGHFAAESLRNEGYGGPVTIISADAWQPYDRPNLSKDYLAGTAGEDWLDLRDGDFYAAQGITIRTGTPIASVDTSSHELVLESGERVPYGALLLAPGASASRLPIDGMDLPHVHVLRDRADTEAIIAALEPGAAAAVIGASFIGMEIAASLRHREIPVTVIAPEDVPLEAILGPELGARIKALHEENGVAFQLGRKPTRIEAERVVLDDGSEVGASIVLVGVGVKPRLELAQSAGIQAERDIPVNSFLETAVPGIWAAGDVASVPDARSGAPLRVEHWVVAQRQGYIAALNMLGRQEPYREVPFFWSQHYDVTVAYVGHAEKPDRITVDGDLSANDALVAYWKDGRVEAVATIFRDTDSLNAELAMEKADEDALRTLAGA